MPRYSRVVKHNVNFKKKISKHYDTQFLLKWKSTASISKFPKQNQVRAPIVLDDK